jgi:hypothetical protein
MELNPEQERLARELAALTGETVETAVKRALSWKLRQIIGEKRFAEEFPNEVHSD